MLRRGTLDDFPAAAALRQRAWPDVIITAEGMRHQLESHGELAKLGYFAVEADGQLIGWATAGWARYEERPELGSLNLSVDPDQRQKGIGTQLAAAADAHLAEIGMTATMAGSLDTPAARALATARGFVEVGSSAVSAVDPRTVTALPVPDGVEIRSFNELDDPFALYEADMELMADVPFAPAEHSSFEQWLADWWEGPMIDRDASVVALIDGVLASMTMIRVDRPSGRAQNNLAGTRRPYRKRGLATLVKSHSLARAAALGATIAVTSNEERNGPMLAVNTRLGYRPFTRRLEWERTSDAASEAA